MQACEQHDLLSRAGTEPVLKLEKNACSGFLYSTPIWTQHEQTTAPGRGRASPGRVGWVVDVLVWAEPRELPWPFQKEKHSSAYPCLSQGRLAPFRGSLLQVHFIPNKGLFSGVLNGCSELLTSLE